MKTHSEWRSLSTISERTSSRRQLARLHETESLTLDVVHLTIEIQVALLHAPVIFEVFNLAKLVIFTRPFTMRPTYLTTILTCVQVYDTMIDNWVVLKTSTRREVFGGDSGHGGIPCTVRTLTAGTRTETWNDRTTRDRIQHHSEA